MKKMVCLHPALPRDRLSVGTPLFLTRSSFQRKSHALDVAFLIDSLLDD